MNRRLQQFLDAENISQAQFAAMIHVSPASIAHILAGRNRPGFDFIQNTMKAFPNLNIEWLITGQGKIYKTANNTVAAPTPLPENPSGANVQDSLFGNDFQEDLTPAPVIEDPSGIKKNWPVRQSDGNIRPTIGKDSPVEAIQTAVNQRKAIKIVIFYDDGTFQELR